MVDTLLGAVIVAGLIYFLLKFIHLEKHCNHKCDECRHPCHTRT